MNRDAIVNEKLREEKMKQIAANKEEERKNKMSLNDQLQSDFDIEGKTQFDTLRSEGNSKDELNIENSQTRLNNDYEKYITSAEVSQRNLPTINTGEAKVVGKQDQRRNKIMFEELDDLSINSGTSTPKEKGKALAKFSIVQDT